MIPAHAEAAKNTKDVVADKQSSNQRQFRVFVIQK